MRKHYSFEDPSVKICAAMIACDGTTLRNGRNICAKCESAKSKRLRASSVDVLSSEAGGKAQC